MFYLTKPGRTIVAPYLFSGVSGLFATGSAAPGVNKSVLAIPVGVGAELSVTRNLSLYGEASYRFGVTRAANDISAIFARASAGPCGDVNNLDCLPCTDPASSNPACKPCDAPDTTNPICLPCDDPNSTDPNCPLVGDAGDTKVGHALQLGALHGRHPPRLQPGAGGVHPPPPPVIPPPVVVVPPPPVVAPPRPSAT